MSSLLRICQRIVVGVCAVLFLSVAFAESEYSFRDRMSELHPNRLSGDALPLQPNEIGIDSSWCICCKSQDATVKHAVDDLKDYFKRSMGIALKVDDRCIIDANARQIIVAVDSGLGALQAKISVSSSIIRVSGANPRETMQGCYRLEDLLNVRGRPFIACGDRSFTRTFSPRMTHSGWEVERFPDIYMDQVAHAGMDAILVFVEDPPNMTRNGREDLQALSKRACTHGLDVYAYCSFPVKAAKYNPNDAGAEDWYDKTYGSIVREAPGIRGMIFVGESVAFPVRDGSSAGYWWGRKDERRPNKPLNGFYPTDEWALWLQKVSKVTRRYRSDLDLVFWTYNWYSRPAEIRLPLLEKIPTNITLLVTFAMGDTPEKKLGIDTWMWDYSITRPGPGKVFESEADVAKRRGIRLYSMANTGGRTWDIGCAPYQPVPGRWITRFKNLREARSRWGLSGLMECHHYGFQPNLISELAKISFTDETDMKSLIDILRKIAARDFGHDNVDAVLSAWQDWAEAFSWHSAHHCDLAGPLRTGPTYPFVLPGERRPEPLEPVYDYYEGKRVGDGWRYLEPEYSMPYDLLPTYVEMSRREIDFWEKGCSKLRMVMKRVPISTIGAARRILANGEFHLSTARTLLNVRLFRLQGAKYLDESLSLADRQTARDSLLEIIKDERTNVERTIGVVEVDSALGWEPTMHYVCGPRQLKWKLQHLSSVERMLHAPDRSALREGFK